MQVIEILPGTSIRAAIERGISIARQRNRPVRFDFNGMEVVTTPDDEADSVERAVDEKWAAQRAAYQASPGGKKAARERAERLAKHQADHDRLMAALPDAFASEPQIMDWLDQFADAADDIGVTGRNFSAVITALEARGYKENDATGLSEEEYTVPGVLVRYVVGQAINCLAKGMPPHPLTHRFVKKYRSRGATG